MAQIRKNDPSVDAAYHLESPSSSGGKFWIIYLIGSSVEVHFGPINKAGQRRYKNFMTQQGAGRYVAQKMTEKLAEQYREVDRYHRPTKPVASATSTPATPSQNKKPAPDAPSATPGNWGIDGWF